MKWQMVVIEKEKIGALANAQGVSPDFHSDSWLPCWLRDCFGKECFQEVASVEWILEEVDDQSFEMISDLDYLQDLIIHGARITDPGISHITALPRLKKLTIHACEISEKQLAILLESASLESLVLVRTGVSDSYFEELRTVGNLNGVHVSR